MAHVLVNLDVQGEDTRPACPHCGRGLSQLRLTPGDAQVSSVVSLVIDTFSCTECMKIISAAGRK